MEIIGYPNYLIYEDGRVWSNNVKRFLKPGLGGHGYYNVSLRNNKIKRTHTIHRLIAQHYIPNPNNYPTVDHIDRCRTNNNISNLRWASRDMQIKNRAPSKNYKISKNNKSGHKYIYYDNTRNKWLFRIRLNRIDKRKQLDNKIDAICYKFIMILKYKLL